ncbi:twin-arginine translocation pathway signal [Roseovarius sp. TE539]|uniref:DUF1501 domain-containing protein n=1 Tax=Roseovarius sp. TE539 TaxID=2249812 RepID=UPI000DDD9FB7|nr:DUF1501 domain-containing protein [Roseovarius sp. TE539]RBI75751.1 twin-arginine translocation pathway signal [Roseovarius sp. TE539]
MAGHAPARREFLSNGAALGCCLAASPILTPVTLASAPHDHRLVVIILRGGMDGLDVIRPLGDAAFSTLRPDLRLKETDRGMDLDGFFALHPALAGLMPLWRAGEFAAFHAVSTPYRGKRSHFDGQDVLESGIGLEDRQTRSDGWLNRVLQQLPGAESETAYAIGRSDMLLTRGAAEVADWAPDAALVLSPQAQSLLEMVMHDDPLFRDATIEAIALSGTDLAAQPGRSAPRGGDMMNAMRENMRAARGGARPASIARFAADRLRQDTRIAAFSLNGFDTHSRQDKSLPGSLERLAEAIMTLRNNLGPVWERTTVAAMTEFGRTARLNGSGGTDHGTGGAMLLAGGAVRGGRVLTDWPGLAEADLFQGRDLRPTRDLRAPLGWLLRDLFGFEKRVIETAIFPGADMGPDPGLTR